MVICAYRILAEQNEVFSPCDYRYPFIQFAGRPRGMEFWFNLSYVEHKILSRGLLAQVKSVARRLGVSVSWYPPPHSKQWLLKDFLTQSRINCVLDVGAFVGQYAAELRDLGYQGRIIGFEPVPDSFNQMKRNLKADPFWIGLPYGLSNVSRDADIYTYGSGDFNSLLVLKDEAERAFGLDHAKRGKIQIKLRRLDEVLPDLLQGVDSPRVFLKMDTQGHDVNVMRGASGVNKWIVGLQSEISAVPLYEEMLSMSQMLEYYRSCGFVPVGLYPASTLRNKLLCPEFDVILNLFDGHLTSTPTVCR